MKIKVLHVITRFIAGGAQDVTLIMVERLVQRGFDVVLACAPEKKRVEEARKRGVKIALIPEFRREISPLNDLKAFFRLYCLIRKSKFHIVHTHTSKAGILGRLAARLARTPIVIHSPHGSIFHRTYYNKFVLFLIALIEKFAALFADKIVPLSEGGRRDYLRYRIAEPEKYVTIYSAIELDCFSRVRVDITGKKEELGIPPGAPVVGLIARLSPEKGHGLCLEAFSRVLSVIPEAILLIVGEGSLEKDIRMKVNQLGIEKNVIVCGYRSDIPEIVQILDVSVHPSLWDGIPRSMVEAMVSGKPVVATAVGGIPEVVIPGKTGLLVPARDREALAEGMVRLLKDRELAERLADAGLKRVRRMFDSETMVEKLVKLYCELIEDKLG